jgi:hypothetical protein
MGVYSDVVIGFCSDISGFAGGGALGGTGDRDTSVDDVA